MGYLGRRIGLSQDKGDSTPGGAGGAVGGGILDLFASGYFERQDKTFNAPSAAAVEMQASGGVIADYESGGTQYRTHTFTTSGTFQITTLSSNFTNSGKFDVFLIAGGAGGGGGNSTYGGGGGGAGGAIEVTAYPASVATYPITIGAGGQGGMGGNGQNNSTAGINGTDTTFTDPSPKVLTAKGGGGGGTGNTPQGGTDQDPAGNYDGGYNGGCGGGGGSHGAPHPGSFMPGGSTTQTDPVNPGVANLTNVGTAGGTGNGGNSRANGGGGGGHGGAGTAAATGNNNGGAGGNGRNNNWSTGSNITYGGGGGGAGAGSGGTGGSGGPGGGGTAQTQGSAPAGSRGGDGTLGLGAGGGGGTQGPSQGSGGAGGSGLCVIRYIRSSAAGTAKATGGQITFTGTKTVHTFTASGAFQVTDAGLTSIEILAIAGGGGGGGARATHGAPGGGGAGGAVHDSSKTVSNTGGPSSDGAYPISIGAGGRGGNGHPDITRTSHGNAGTDTTFTTGSTPTNIVCKGGGQGRYQTGDAGGTGGCGGGGGGAPGGSGAGGSGGAGVVIIAYPT